MKKLIIVLLVIVVAVILIFTLTDSDTPLNESEQTGPETIDNQSEAETRAENDTEIEVALVGEWQSTTDANSYKIFSADGSITERYESEPTVESKGSWELFSASEPVTTIEAPLDPVVTYLRITEGDEQYHYSITSVSETELELVYLDRGGVLTYQRVSSD